MMRCVPLTSARKVVLSAEHKSKPRRCQARKAKQKSECTQGIRLAAQHTLVKSVESGGCEQRRGSQKKRQLHSCSPVLMENLGFV
jgi:hypothetical protein